ncbi:ChbG/HpnK family deacetylase [Pseudomonas muyukensis]|uniref:ChbG/HpnK family deacetylase n=1 Tax=Pseudomonas muyukensis TaxID=2842357 RepID=A0ABX8M4A3_9PSED|nr:ChbG/HpnK family deacetylase [Pseudomonas muyukensis]QXH33358.1 ChbG/HpnK family deacetylase [Pseudomonas muyukensis]
MPSQVIVNADDFGLSAHTNAVILHAFQAGLISSATAMANMPAFAAACTLAQQPALKGRVGLHFNLTYGRPLSRAILAEPRFCTPHGEFDLRLKQRTLRLSRRERAAVAQELEAQWKHCLDHGLMPSHLDSHQHVHNIWPVGEVVARFARSQGVPIRLARNIGHNIGPLKRLFKTLLNRRLHQLCGVTADHVCTPADVRAGLAPAHGVLEVVAHPSALGSQDFGDAYLARGESLKALIEQRLGDRPRVSYTSLVQRAPVV